jgi:hypothetical protein
MALTSTQQMIQAYTANEFTVQELQELGYEALTEQMATDIKSESPAVQAELADEHMQITEAYNAVVDQAHLLKTTGEWENLENDIVFGDFGGPERVNELWDEHEMLYDMNAFESDVNAQKFLASSGENSCQAEVTISTDGQNYATGESNMGKVFIPKHLTRFFRGSKGPKTCVIAYNGCEDARANAKIRMPWKCMYVNQ